MKNRFFLLSVLAAAAVMPGTASANLVLDLPPILAGNGNPNSTCNQSTCAQQGGICCGGQCQTTNCTYCCSNQCQTTPCTPPATTGTLNDTGITWSGNATGNATNCSDNSQDCGYGSNSFSFAPTKTGGCIYDSVTGLTWSPDQGVDVWTGIASKATSAKNISLCNKTDWRAPTLKELLSIVSYNNMSSIPLVNSSFSVTGGLKTDKPYWSGTPTINSSNAWAVSFSSGWSSQLAKNDTYNVILVSGATSTPSFSVDNTAGTVTDNNTKLIWKKCLVGLSGTNCDQGAATTYSWAGALALTGNGWRLPNLKELQSIVKEDSSPAIDASIFPNANFTVWSSSPHSKSVVVNNVTRWKAWAVEFSTGSFGEYFRDTAALYVRLVKDPTT